MPAKLTPALANAKSGKITKDDQEDKICSKSSNGRSPFFTFQWNAKTNNNAC